MSRPVDDKNVADQISKLYDLHQAGVLSKAEFEQAKHKALGSRPPRLAAQLPTGYERQGSQPSHLSAPQKEPRSAKTVLLIAAIVLGTIYIFNSLLDSGGDEDANNRIAAVPTATTPSVPATPAEPTATAIPRSGIQNFTLSITVLGDWEAWGEGCVGGGDVKWANSSAGVVITPSDASGTFQGTFQGRELGAGDLQGGDRCQWFVNLTSRASDSYRITIGDYDVVCHSNTMLPTDDGFYAAVAIDADGISCATVESVSDQPATPAP